MTNEIRIAHIGSGPRGQGCIRRSASQKGLRIVAVCDKFENMARKGVEASGDPNVKRHTDYRRILDDPDIDAVFVCVQPENNAALVVEALEAGKHVMSEVPLAFTIEECWNVVLAVERTGLKYQLAEQVRYSPFVFAWKKMIAEGRLGKILFAQGQYLHSRGRNRYWQDSETGETMTIEQAQNNPRAIKSRVWTMPHAILYLPHELSPLLHILDDRVVSVSCMGTRPQSYVHEWFPAADLEAALMRTEKDTVMRLVCGFIAPATTPHHWYHLMGTRGVVETNRYDGDSMKMWFAESQMTRPAEIEWAFNPEDTPPEALSSGHGGMDYYPFATFAQSVLDDVEPAMDVYKAAESAAPAIMAALSAEQGSQCLPVPDFRPGPERKPGDPPRA